MDDQLNNEKNTTSSLYICVNHEKGDGSCNFFGSYKPNIYIYNNKYMFGKSLFKYLNKYIFTIDYEPVKIFSNNFDKFEELVDLFLMKKTIGISNCSFLEVKELTEQDINCKTISTSIEEYTFQCSCSIISLRKEIMGICNSTSTNHQKF